MTPETASAGAAVADASKDGKGTETLKTPDGENKQGFIEKTRAKARALGTKLRARLGRKKPEGTQGDEGLKLIATVTDGDNAEKNDAQATTPVEGSSDVSKPIDDDSAKVEKYKRRVQELGRVRRWASKKKKEAYAQDRQALRNEFWGDKASSPKAAPATSEKPPVSSDPAEATAAPPATADAETPIHASASEPTASETPTATPPTADGEQKAEAGKTQTGTAPEVTQPPATDPITSENPTTTSPETPAPASVPPEAATNPDATASQPPDLTESPSAETEDGEITSEMINKYKELDNKFKRSWDSKDNEPLTPTEASERRKLQEKLSRNADIDVLIEAGILSKGDADDHEIEGEINPTDSIKKQLKELGIPLTSENANILLETANKNPDAVQGIMDELDKVQNLRDEIGQLEGSEISSQALHRITEVIFSDVVDRFKENYSKTIAEAMKGDATIGQKAEKMAVVLALLVLLLNTLRAVTFEKASELAGVGGQK